MEINLTLAEALKTCFTTITKEDAAFSGAVAEG